MELLAVKGIIFAKKKQYRCLASSNIFSAKSKSRILQTNLVVLLFAVNKKQLMNSLTITCSKTTTETIEKGVK